MKTIKSILPIIMVIIGLSSTQAQTDTNIIFLHQNEMFSELQKFNIPVLGFSIQDPCERSGQTPTFGKRDTTILIAFDPADTAAIFDTSIVVYIDTLPERNVYWIHGLNGTVESWRKAAYASEMNSQSVPDFPARKLHSILDTYVGTQSYSETGDINAASIGLREVANGINYSHTDRDFIIAHSQGGIVSREWLRNMDENPYNTFPNNYAHGLVTFGTPHAGARILNNTRPINGTPNPKLTQFVSEACNKLGKAKVTSDVQENFLTRLLISSNMINNIVGSGCEVLSKSIIPAALDNYHKPTTQDYYVGAPFLTQPNQNNHPTSLSDYTLKVPVVQFYGEETHPIMWKFFSSTLELGTNTMDNNQRIFGYDTDDQLEKKVKVMKDDFQAKYNLAKETYDFWDNTPCWVSLLSLPVYVTCKIMKDTKMYNNKKLMDAYGGAVEWLTNANDYYLDLIGARECITQQKICYYVDYVTCKVKNFYPVYNPLTGQYEDSTTYMLSFARQEVAATPQTSCAAGWTTPQYYPPIYPNSTCTVIRRYITTIYKRSCTVKPSDGVVLSESAAAPILVQSGKSHTYRRMPETNHDQMKNSSKTKAALLELYNGENNIGWFFRTDPR